MTIDILIPTYNRKIFLEKAINSVLNQSYKDINIIISDNNSSDGTNKLMAKYNNYENIYYHKNKKNLGHLLNYKKCIYEYSKSDYVLFLSDDDELLDKDFIKKSMEMIKKYNNLSIVISNTKIFYNDFNLEFIEDKKLKKITDGKTFFLNYGLGNYSISWCNAIFKKKLAIESNCYNGDINYIDTDCFFKLMILGDIGFIDTIGAIYKVHSKNGSKSLPVETYIKNEDYILKNYKFAKKYIEISLLNKWKNRMLKGYYNNTFNNFILFSIKPFHDIKVFKKYLKLNNKKFSFGFYNYIKLFIVRFFMKIPFIHKQLIIINNNK